MDDGETEDAASQDAALGDDATTRQRLDQGDNEDTVQHDSSTQTSLATQTSTGPPVVSETPSADVSDAPPPATGSKLTGQSSSMSDRPAMMAAPTQTPPALVASSPVPLRPLPPPAPAPAVDLPPLPNPPPAYPPITPSDEKSVSVSDASASSQAAALEDASAKIKHAAPISSSALPQKAANPAAPVASLPPPPQKSSSAQPSSSQRANSTPSSGSSQGASPAEKVGDAHMIHAFHLAIFAILLLGGVTFATFFIHFTSDLGLFLSAAQVARKLAKSLAFRQSLAIMVALAFVRFALEPLVKSVRGIFKLPGPWERTREHYILAQLYKPLEFLLFTAAVCTAVEASVPPLIGVSKETVRHCVRTTLNITFVMCVNQFCRRVKSRIVQDELAKAESTGDVTQQRRVEAIEKFVTIIIVFVTTVLSLQAVGLELNSVLAISGFGGLALGLAGREILENLFNTLVIITNRSFDVGEEILFTQAGHAGRIIEGIVLDIGWYQTTIRSFEREIIVIPNSVFSRTVLLNVTRKGKEWRFCESIGLRLRDIDAVSNIASDMRRIIRADPRVIQKLHRRVFLDKLRREEITVYLSFYLQAANRDAFMAARQDLFLAFVTACRRHGAELATNRFEIDFSDGVSKLAAPTQAIPEICVEHPDFPDEPLPNYASNNPFPS